jgi:predicted transcriptional regulator
MARNSKADDGESDHGANRMDLLELTTEIVRSYLSYNRVAESEITSVIRSVYSSLANLEGSPEAVGTSRAPAVAIKKSVTDDFIICLEDGKKLRTLKRYLRTQYQMSPDEYRAKWQLPRDYPMVAPSYTRLRSAFATKIGLGRTAVRRGRRARTA